MAAEAAPHAASPAVDQVIVEEYLADTPEQQAARARLADEMIYDLSRPLRDADPDNQQLTTLLNDVVALSPQDRDQLLLQSDAIAQQLVKPLAYKVLELHGLDPKTADPEAARQALRAPVTPEQQQLLQQAYSTAFDDVYGQSVADVLEEVGLKVDRRSPDQVWQEFERYVQRLEEEEAASSKPSGTTVAAIGVPAALVGGLVTLAVTQLLSWLRRRRRGGGRSSRGGSAGSSSLPGSSYGEEGELLSEGSQL